MSKIIDLKGRKFGRLIVIKLLPERRRSQKVWQCVCECGAVKGVPSYHLLNSLTVSCGCYGKSVIGNATRKHGMRNSKEYQTWKLMRQRCNNENCERFPRYGGRGIKICERWNDFQNFFDDMGSKPSSEHSINRINNDGDYEPSNCEWADRETQSSNTSKSVKISFGGEVKTLTQWAKSLGCGEGTLRTRLNRLNWPIEKALTQPVR